MVVELILCAIVVSAALDFSFFGLTLIVILVGKLYFLP